MTSFRRQVLAALKGLSDTIGDPLEPGPKTIFGQLKVIRDRMGSGGGTVDLGNIPAQVAGLVTAAKTTLDALGLMSHLINDGNTVILKKLEDVLKKEDRLMATADEILADVQDEATVVGSVETLLTNLSTLIAAAGTDPVKLQAIRDQIDQNKARLTAAVVANTPAATPAP